MYRVVVWDETARTVVRHIGFPSVYVQVGVYVILWTFWSDWSWTRVSHFREYEVDWSGTLPWSDRPCMFAIFVNPPPAHTFVQKILHGVVRMQTLKDQTRFPFV
jgi:hypothetical protein